MAKNSLWNNENLICLLKGGGVAVIPTDTLYGIVGRAQNSTTVERIYKTRKRNPEKPCIILIGDVNELKNFLVSISEKQKEILAKYWSFDFVQDKYEPASLVFDCADDKFKYLHRGTKTLAFRVPMQKELQNLLKQTGPLIAPSANPEGLPPAQNIAEAKKYFGSEVDLYIDGGEIKGKVSKVIKLHKDGTITVLRP